MEEAQEILLSALEASGVSLPSDVSSIEELSSDGLVSICAQSLHLIDKSFSLSTDMPVLMADKVKTCTELATAVKSIGYRGDLNFHLFLYPSDEDLYKLVRFLVEKLSKTTKASNAGVKEEDGFCVEKTEVDSGRPDVLVFREKELLGMEGNKLSEDSRFEEHVSEGTNKSVIELEVKLTSLLEESSKIRLKVESLEKQEKNLELEVGSRTSDVQNLEEEAVYLKKLVEMTPDNQQFDSYVEELIKRIEARQCDTTELEPKRSILELPVDGQSCTFEQSTDHHVFDEQQELQLQKIKLETEAILSEISRREEEHSKLMVELENQAKVPSRKSYIHRITEITKNSRKQDADIERILQDTRELQIESNSIQDRLHRIYTVVDEAVFRDAKNDPVRRQAYKLLASIHRSFNQISDEILATDRARREAAELEAKLSAMPSHKFDIEKLQSDLEALRKENDFLEQQSTA
ncbi:hypothetical protein H6P81_008495 [Aristolochia fimbriata]|uniref:Coiled-coil domain-containing protein 22 homolog n=1 Tax=Aristolochia fimbriata TaxID=158543 RepID=A0AAV7EI53_ARIFI|nr:hypothetical protein H6P81_008495 [Aristolochia fimbriata]